MNHAKKTVDHPGGEVLSVVLRNAPLAIVGVDREGVITLCEGKLLQSLGTSPGENLGRSVFELWKSCPGLLGNIRRALSGESIAAIEEIKGVVLEAQYS